MTTLFSTNVRSGTAMSMHSDSLNNNSSITRLLRSAPFVQLNELMNQVSLGNFQNLIDNFNLNTFNELALKLYALKTNSHPIYVRLLNYLNYCLTTMLVVEVTSKEMVVLRSEITKLKADNAILQNVELLKAYLETLTKKTFTIFSEQKVSMSRIKLRPEYDVYIQRYGFPKNGAFNYDTLAEIITELKNAAQNT
jgi:hypothetical protein